MDQLLLFPAYGLDAVKPGRCWISPCPDKLCGCAAQEKPGSGAASCCKVAATTHRLIAKQEGRTARHSLGAAAALGCAAPSLLLPPGSAGAGSGLSKSFEIQHYVKVEMQKQGNLISPHPKPSPGPAGAGGAGQAPQLLPWGDTEDANLKSSITSSALQPRVRAAMGLNQRPT